MGHLGLVPNRLRGRASGDRYQMLRLGFHLGLKNSEVDSMAKEEIS